MTETWLPVANYEGIYEVSDLGRVRSLPRTVICRNGRRLSKPGRVMQCHRPPPSRPGVMAYPMVRLSRDGKKHWIRVHRIVLTAFAGPRQEGHVCRHLNGDPDDNRLINLAWGTTAENMTDQVRHGTHGNAIKVECKRGHQFTDENTYMHPRGFRQCRQCVRDARGVSTPRGPRKALAA